MRNVIIGVDGGTQTRLVAVDTDLGTVVAGSLTGSIHAGNLGHEVALYNLKLGVDALGLSREDRILAIGLGDPATDGSSGGAKNGEALRLAAEALCAPGGICISKSDAFMALYAFSCGEPAALLTAGTGFMGIALKNKYDPSGENDIHTVGGWGDPGCDSGSAYDIAVRGIQAAMQAFDGVAPQTLLCRAILAFYGADEPRNLVSIFNSEKLPRSHIAAFAKQVDSCAMLGDGASLRILRSAGTMLARYARVLLTGMEEPKLGISGSVLLKNQFVRNAFEAEVLKDFPTLKICVPDISAQYGAAMLAADTLGLDRSSWLCP